jgi:predicted CXXCH cytochrome family protein
MQVGQTQCTDCHAPHASASRGLLREVVHPPFAEGSCDLCHRVDSETPQLLHMTGARLCQTCHQDTPPAADRVVHAPVAEGDCLACHATHASSHGGLLVAPVRGTCLTCHQDLLARAETSRTAHVLRDEDGACLGCHRPHSSGEDNLLTSGEIRTCLVCHENQRHGHPLGSDRLDPRTGKSITCVTCHDPHGTDFPMQLRGDQSRGLCLECHSQEGVAGGAERGR